MDRTDGPSPALFAMLVRAATRRCWSRLDHEVRFPRPVVLLTGGQYYLVVAPPDAHTHTHRVLMGVSFFLMLISCSHGV